MSSFFFFDVNNIKDQLRECIKLLKWSSTLLMTNNGIFLNLLERASPYEPNLSEKLGYNDRLLYIFTSGTIEQVC